jgi:hypothetical protein
LLCRKFEIPSLLWSYWLCDDEIAACHSHSQFLLAILNYHQMAGGDLRRHLFYLLQHCRIMHRAVALEELYARRKDRQYSRKRQVSRAFSRVYAGYLWYENILPTQIQILR